MLALEYKLKKAALCAAVDIILRGREKAPNRCVRNLMELGNTVCRRSFNKKEQEGIYQNLLTACRNSSLPDCRTLFFLFYFPQE